MKGILLSLLGMAAILSIMAGVHYASPGVDRREDTLPAFVIAPGEVRTLTLQPSLPDTQILVTFEVTGGPLDFYAIPSPGAARLVEDGEIRLDQAFSYDARWSLQNVSDAATVAIVSDGRTWMDILLDNSDNYYVGDSAPSGVATVEVTARFVAEENRSLVFAYLATAPAVLLVGITLTRQFKRRRDAHRTGTRPGA